MSVGVVLLQPESLIGGEPQSQIASRGSMLQAPEVMLVTVLSRQHWPWRDVAAESCW
jgi:hypothetical protein